IATRASCGEKRSKSDRRSREHAEVSERARRQVTCHRHDPRTLLKMTFTFNDLGRKSLYITVNITVYRSGTVFRSGSVPDDADPERHDPGPRITDRCQAPHGDADLRSWLVAPGRIDPRHVHGYLCARGVEAEVSRCLGEVHRVLELRCVRESEHRPVPA